MERIRRRENRKMTNNRMKKELKWAERGDREKVKKGKEKWEQVGKREKYYKKSLVRSCLRLYLLRY